MSGQSRGIPYFRENFALSHSKERPEKICLNCNAELIGRYCHVCGQENIQPKETVWGLVTHFFYDITHFDGKFFSTLKYLVAKPGFLSAEYIRGRRASHLNPIRMYVFTSAFFFIIFFSIYDTGPVFVTKTAKSREQDSIELAKAKSARERALALAHTKEDSAEILAGLAVFTDTLPAVGADSARADTATLKKGGFKVSLWTSDDEDYPYKTVEEYDSIQATLPAKERDGFFKRTLTRRQLKLQAVYGDDDKALMRAWINAFIHQFPKLLFVSLPIFALILRLLYIRRRKQFYYVDHGIFSIHLYIFSFILLLASMGLTGLESATGWGVFTWLQLPLWLYSLYYIYKAMRVFYGQRRGKTIVKFILLNVLATATIIILFVLFFVLAVFQI